MDQEAQTGTSSQERASDTRQPYTPPRVRSQEAYEKLALASCSFGGADEAVCNFA